MSEELEYRWTNYWEPEDEDNVYNPEDLMYPSQDKHDEYDPLWEIRALNNWVGYKLIQREGKVSKMPIDPHTGKGAKADDASTWGSYEQASETVRKYNLDGVGFELGVNFQGYVGVDLDHVLREDGTLEPFAAEILTYSPHLKAGDSSIINAACRNRSYCVSSNGRCPNHFVFYFHLLL